MLHRLPKSAHPRFQAVEEVRVSTRAEINCEMLESRGVGIADPCQPRVASLEDVVGTLSCTPQFTAAQVHTHCELCIECEPVDGEEHALGLSMNLAAGSRKGQVVATDDNRVV